MPITLQGGNLGECYYCLYVLIIWKTALSGAVSFSNNRLMTLNLTTAQTYYTFALYPVDTKFNRIAGIYIFLVIPPRHVELSSRACRGTTSHPPMAEVPETAAEALGTVAEALEARHPELVSGSHSESNSEPIQEKLSSLKGTGGCENIQPEINTHHPASRHPELVEGQQYSLLYIGITNFKLRFQ